MSGQCHNNITLAIRQKIDKHKDVTVWRHRRFMMTSCIYLWSEGQLLLFTLCENMKTFKKLFASITAVMVVVASMPGVVPAAYAYSDEQVAAYEFAANATPVAITTKTLADSNMNNTMTRMQAASFIARAVKDFAPALPVLENADCSFVDVSVSVYGQEMVDNLTYVCERGIFGYQVGDYYSPEAGTTRAQMVTALMRTVDREYANNTSPMYYSASMDWMASNINLTNTNPDMLELRGTMMIMIKRLYDMDARNGETDYCDSLEVQIECFLGNCPAECTDVPEPECPPGEEFDADLGECVVSENPESNGDLEVSLNSNSPEAHSIRSFCW